MDVPGSQGSLELLRHNVEKAFTFSEEELNRVLTKEELIKLCKHKKCCVSLEWLSPVNDLKKKLGSEGPFQSVRSPKTRMNLLYSANKNKKFAEKTLSEKEFFNSMRRFSWETRKAFNVRWLNKIAKRQTEAALSIKKMNIEDDMESDITQSEFLGFSEQELAFNESSFIEINSEDDGNNKDGVHNQKAYRNIPKNHISKRSNSVNQEPKKIYNKKKIDKDHRIPLKTRKISYHHYNKDKFYSEDPIRNAYESADRKNRISKCISESSETINADSEYSESDSQEEISLFVNSEDESASNVVSIDLSSSRFTTNECIGIFNPLDKVSNSYLKGENTLSVKSSANINEKMIPIILLLNDNQCDYGYFVRCKELFCSNRGDDEERDCHGNKSRNVEPNFNNSFTIKEQALNKLIVAKVKSVEQDVFLEFQNSEPNNNTVQNFSRNKEISNIKQKRNPEKTNFKTRNLAQSDERSAAEDIPYYEEKRADTPNWEQFLKDIDAILP